MPDLPTDKELQKAARRKPRRGRPVKPPKRDEMRFRRAMSALWNDVLTPATERIRQLVRQGASPAAIAKELEDSLSMANLRYSYAAQGIVDRWIVGVDREVRNAISRTMRDALGVDLDAVLAQPNVADALGTAGTRAAMLIKTIPQEYLGKVAEAVYANFSGSPLPEGRSLLAQIEHLGGVSYKRARLIARDQTSKITSALTQERQSAIGIETYRWRGVRDQRETGNPNGLYPVGNDKHGNHWAMEGFLFRWDDNSVYSADNGKTWRKRPASWSQATPGWDIQCRCTAEPVINPESIVAKALQRSNHV